MRVWLQNVLAVLLGLVCGMAVNMALIQLNYSVFFPMPASLDTSDVVAFNSYLVGLPWEAFLLVILAHVLQAFIGGYVAARLTRTYPMRCAMVVGVISLAGGLWAMTLYQGPGWMVIELPLYLLAGYYSGSIERRRRGSLQ